MLKIKTAQKVKQKGSSLLEVLLYIALLGIIMFPITYFIPAMSEARIKNVAISEVDQQGLQVSRLITQTIRNARSITSPAEGTNADQLSLEAESASSVSFSLENNILEINRDGIITNLTSSQILASNLAFSNFSAPDTYGTIRFQFTLSNKNTLGRQEYSYTKTFTGSATLR